MSGLTNAASAGILHGPNQLPATAMEQDAVAQGIRLATERHQHFDFLELGARGIIGGIAGGGMAKAGREKLADITGSVISRKVQEISTGMAQGALQGSISGQGFNAGDALAGSLGDAIGSGFAEEVSESPKPQVREKPQHDDFNIEEIWRGW